ncbi:hypothetical protein KVT40_002273 [Elsinoe batatas]|uniref:Pectinesterase n=1 Tax=Elsinoe batatas TaxID=2601811 RepID=A0A8K0L8V8_9PEZI|nr:hypothetical protein KVT40_002273 [Elsinoe batatas]
MLVSYTALLGLVSGVLAAPNRYVRTTPPSSAVIVDSTGTQANSVLTVGAAIARLTNTTDAQSIFIYPGVYREQVYIPPLAGALTVQGYTSDARSYSDNQVTITFNLSRTTPGLANNDATSTVRLWTKNVKLYNLNIANTFGSAPTNGQALALSAQATNQGFYGCNFTGYQDTIYANEGRQIYAQSFISGATDFIFGLRARAWFEEVDIDVIGPGFITANGREAENNTSFYVFNKARIEGSSGPNSTYLGRPWRQFSRVVFQRSYISDVVRPEGWSRWDAVQTTANVVYKEYKNYGPGAATGARANFSSRATEPVKIAEILGKNYEKEEWVDRTYL